MANRYWVGGTASWDGTAGAKWSLTSGGTGDQAIPTSSDDVFFDANSGAVTVTVATGNTNCQNLDCTGFTGTLAGSAAISVFGNFTLVAGMTRTYTGALTFAATATGKTITLGTKTTASAVVFNGVGGGWTVQDAWSNGTSAMTLTAGTFNTNGQAITCGTFSGSGTTTRTLTLGATTLTCTTWTMTTTTNLTFNANTSTIVKNGTGGFSGGGLTYNNATINPETNANMTFSGANTFATLTITCGANKGNRIQVSGNQTITGALAINGNSAVNRIWLTSSITGTARTFTAGSLSASSNVDFRDITGAGAASPFTGTSFGDTGNNSSITTDTPTTRYWVGNGGNWSDTARWSTSSGGASGASVPLPQDAVVVDANSITSASQTITMDMRSAGTNINFTGVLNNPVLAMGSGAVGNFWHGDLTLVSGMTQSSGGTTFFAPKPSTTVTITTNTVSLAGSIFFQSFSSATLNLGSDFTGTGAFFSLSGTMSAFNTENFNMTVVNFISSGGTPVSLGSSTITCTGTGAQAWDIGGTVLTAGTSTIILNNATTTSKTFVGGSEVYNNVEFAGAGTGTFIITGSNTFKDLKVTTPPHTVNFTAGTTQTITTLTASGTAGNLNILQSVTGGSAWNLSTNSGNISIDYVSLQDSVGNPSTRTSVYFAGVNSTNVSGNVRWIFAAPVLTDAKSFFKVMT